MTSATPLRWSQRLWYFAIFFTVALLVLQGWRYGLFAFYKPAELPSSVWVDELEIGLRMDAKYLAIAIAPAWLLLFVSRIWSPFWKVAKVWLAVTIVFLVVLDAINFGFYGFYGVTINSTVFGFWYDDTEAIVKTIWADWPIGTYVVVIAVSIVLPFLVARWGACPGWLRRDHWFVVLMCFVLGTAALAAMMRGSFGTFPLGLQDFVASPHPYVNRVIPNGPAAFYYAVQEQRALALGDDPASGVKAAGFSSPQQAHSALQTILRDIPAADTNRHLDHVVFCVMESMGMDEFSSHTPGKNNTLGRLAQAIEFPNAVVFRQALSVQNGTFPSLEGLLFDTPLTPLSQTQYGRDDFPFSRAMLFKKAGYETVFLTSGTTQWHDLDKTLPLHGFDRTIGAVDIRAQFPGIEYGTWGVGDRWTFEVAKRLLTEADRQGKKLFLVILSATNHPPFHVPDGAKLEPVNTDYLFPAIEREPQTEIMLQTYQYAADALGGFVQWLAGTDMGKHTLTVATGDHNARFTYTDGAVWHHRYGVPLLFWLPQDLLSLKTQARTEQWVSHRDLFPTVSALILGRAPELQEGRNLFAPLPFDAATSWTVGRNGAVIGAAGGALLENKGSCGCYSWQGDHLMPSTCEGELNNYCTYGWAQRGLADYKIRETLIQQRRSTKK